MDLKFAQKRLLLILRTRLKLNKRVKIGLNWLKCITLKNETDIDVNF